MINAHAGEAVLQGVVEHGHGSLPQQMLKGSHKGWVLFWLQLFVFWQQYVSLLSPSQSTSFVTVVKPERVFFAFGWIMPCQFELPSVLDTCASGILSMKQTPAKLEAFLG